MQRCWYVVVSEVRTHYLSVVWAQYLPGLGQTAIWGPRYHTLVCYAGFRVEGFRVSVGGVNIGFTRRGHTRPAGPRGVPVCVTVCMFCVCVCVCVCVCAFCVCAGVCRCVCVCVCAVPHSVLVSAAGVTVVSKALFDTASP